MYDEIDSVVYKISSYCNLDCEYCFQPFDIKEKNVVFNLYNDLIAFLSKCPLKSSFNVRISGGEASLFCDEIYKAYKKFKKLERYQEIDVKLATVSNGSNIKGLIDLWDDGILTSTQSVVSWDGVYSASRSRKPKNKNFDDRFFRNIIVSLGRSNHGDKVLIRTAVTPSTVDNLYDAYRYCMSAGCTVWSYYFLYECDSYRDRRFVSIFKDQITKIYKDYYNNPNHIVHNADVITLNNKIVTEENKYRAIACRHLGNMLFIDNHGYVYPCVNFGGYSKYNDKPIVIGHVSKGFFRKTMEDFCAEYAAMPSCDMSKHKCSAYQCFECPALNKYYNNHMQHKMRQACILKQVELDVYKQIFGNSITDEYYEKIKKRFDYHNLYDEHNNGLNPNLPFYG